MTVAHLAVIGKSWPLGASVHDNGVNFALFSAHAERIELCLFDQSGNSEIARLPLYHGDEDIWHIFIPGLSAGALYGYRVHGPYAPQEGHRFNHHKLLLDPYARQLTRSLAISDPDFGFTIGHSEADLSFDERDNSAAMPKCIVVDNLAPPPVPLSAPVTDPVIYEVNVRGLTMRHPLLKSTERGMFAGLGHPQLLDYLQALGINSIELMPIQYSIDEPVLSAKGLHNYWGYNSIGFFTPANQLYSTGQLQEFKSLVSSLHTAGIEVILDVAFNHTGEGNELGPTLSFKGIDNKSYYRLDPSQPRYYINDSGCGNTLNLQHPRVLQMVMDSLRYWVEAMGIDGFRFDLATALGRKANGFDPTSSFFDVLRQDPVLAGVRLIAEPWDIGQGGYQLGNFPSGWHEWNDRYRDTVRRYWAAEPGMLGELANRLHGSADIFENSGRTPRASINFITSHDGFTLQDLVSYQERHNTENGEENRDGHSANFSCNYGTEGPTENPAINAIRRRQRRNLMATNLLSQGTPMLLSGDELGRTQMGNNNAYCQDNETSWFDWSALDGEELDFFEFVSYVLRLRKRYALLRWPAYMHDDASSSAPQCRWINTAGEPMTPEDWRNRKLHWLGMLLLGPNGNNRRSRMLLLTNSSEQNVPFKMPPVDQAGRWVTLLDTAQQDFSGNHSHMDGGTNLLLAARSLSLFDYEFEEPPNRE